MVFLSPVRVCPSVRRVDAILSKYEKNKIRIVTIATEEKEWRKRSWSEEEMKEEKEESREREKHCKTLVRMLIPTWESHRLENGGGIHTHMYKCTSTRCAV
ncbi:hypothetical protein ANTRET_LOCUS9953 [Anthophora retusa]